MGRYVVRRLLQAVLVVFGVDNWILWEPRKDEMVWAHEMAWNE